MSIPGAKTVTKEIVNDRRPDEQHHGNPNKAHTRIIEPAKKDIAQNDNHQTDIDNHAKQADGEEPVELTQFREKQKHAHQAETKNNSQYRADFFPGVHDVFGVMSIEQRGPGRLGRRMAEALNYVISTTRSTAAEQRVEGLDNWIGL